MATATKASSNLPKEIFAVEVKSHELLKQAYLAYLANSRPNLAKTLTRGDVRGGGKKPWKQKGTGRARFGSSRNPIWRGGGITFGPTGNENYTITMPTSAKRTALRQALTLASQAGKVIVADVSVDGKTKSAQNFLAKQNAGTSVVVVAETRSPEIERSFRNISDVTVLTPKYLTVYHILNADTLIMTDAALKVVSEWLGGTK